MDEMDPEMAAALAASMMDAPAGAVGGSFGGGGLPMMTEASSTAALEALAAVQSAVLAGGEPGEMGALLPSGLPTKPLAAQRDLVGVHPCGGLRRVENVNGS